MSRSALAAVALAALSLTACDSNDPVDPQPEPLEVQTATDVAADPTTGRDPVTGAPISTGRFALYSLRGDSLVLASSDADRADSASTKWDIGFRGTTIIFNGGTSGPGQGAAQVLSDTLFAEVTAAPEGGYVADGSNTCTGGYAVCTGSGSGWYNYDSSQNLITPIAGRTIVLRTAVGTHAKVRILNYYQGNPSTPNPSLPSRYFTFEYVVQPDGSRGFETTTPMLP